MRRSPVLPALCLLAACGSEPTFTSTIPPDIRGTLEGDWELAEPTPSPTGEDPSAAVPCSPQRRGALFIDSEGEGELEIEVVSPCSVAPIPLHHRRFRVEVDAARLLRFSDVGEGLSDSWQCLLDGSPRLLCVQVDPLTREERLFEWGRVRG